MHKNTANKTMTACANIAASNNGNNAKKVYINIAVNINNVKKAYPM